MSLPLFFQRSFCAIFSLSVCVFAYADVPVTLADPSDHNSEFTRIIPYPEPKGKDCDGADKNDPVCRGKYLTQASDCLACHTEVGHEDKPFAGGLGMKTPFGTFYAPNITRDKKTGIGNWSDEDFVKAVQHGVSPKGKFYFPVLPYLYFNRMSEEDIVLIKEYLFSIDGIEKPSKAHKVMFPFSWRFLQLGWRIMFYYPQKGQLQKDETQTDEWNRGKYLAEGPSHCAMCHTPINPLGGPKRRYAYTGMTVDGYFAPNISKAGLKDFSVDQVVGVLAEHKRLSGQGSVGGPMLEAVNNSLRYLEKDDLQAMAVYLKTIESKQPKAPAKSDSSEDLVAGKKIYKAMCATCHQSGGEGSPKFADKQVWDALLKRDSKEQIIENAWTGINGMPAKGNCSSCSRDDIASTVNYMFHEADKNAPKGPMGEPVTLARGEKIFDKNCASCHSPQAKDAPGHWSKQQWQARLQEKKMTGVLEDAIRNHPVHACEVERVPTNNPNITVTQSCNAGDVKSAIWFMLENVGIKGYKLWFSDSEQ